MQQITWVKATASFANGNCVEIATLPDGMIGIRDSKNPQGPILRFAPGEWNAFLTGAQRGEFGQPRPDLTTRRSVAADKAINALRA
jgi:Domain of unknown function (DUF397)